MGKRKSWLSYSGHVDASQVSSEVTGFEVFDTSSQRVRATFETRDEAQAWIDAQPSFFRRFFLIRELGESIFIRRGQLLCPLVPIPEFSEPFTHLATRGFWDVTLDVLSQGTRIRTVANFAMAFHFMPTKAVYHIDVAADGSETFALRSPDQMPDVLLDDAGFHVYESFARITETQSPVAFDPPFYSKSKRKVPAQSALICLIGFDVADIGEAATVANITFGVRCRMLIEK